MAEAKQSQSKGSKPKQQLTEVEGNNGQKWAVVKKLGSGSFGDVFLAVQNHRKQDPPEVAIKVEDLKAAHPQL
jgi:serine/threonine protein kinase